MKKINKYILAGVDYSASAENAIKYAAQLAQKKKLALLLFHVYDVPVLHTYSGLYLISFTTLQNSNTDKLQKYAAALQQKYPSLQIDCITAPQLYREELESVISKRGVKYVVMGLGVKSKLSKFIYGSHGTSVAGKIKAPVIIVPENYKKHKLHKAVLAVDNYKSLKKPVVSGLKNFGKEFEVSFSYLHVKTEEEYLFGKEEQLPENLKIESVKAKEFTDGACRYATKTKADMIVILSHAHSALYNFFNETNTKKIAFRSKVPVMAIHD